MGRSRPVTGMGLALFLPPRTSRSMRDWPGGCLFGSARAHLGEPLGGQAGLPAALGRLEEPLVGSAIESA